jgi:uncharacterized protein YlbG (UPF0298 family)
MSRLMIQVKDMKNIKDLKKYGQIVFEWGELNYVEMEAPIEAIDKIKKYDFVISCIESTEGSYLPCEVAL